MHDLIDCPACRQPLRLPQERRGQRVECPECRHRFVAEVLTVLPADGVTAAAPQRPRPRVSAQAREAAAEVMARVERDERTAPRDHGMPWYLWAMAVLPWLIPVFTLGGCIWVMVAAGLSSAGLAIARAHRTPVPIRLLALLGIDGLSFLIVLTLYVALFGLPHLSFPGRPSWANVAAPAGPPAPAQPMRPLPFGQQPVPQLPPPKVPPAATLMPGLLAYWPFEDDPARGAVEDPSGRGNLATAHGATRTGGIRGQALHFTGRAWLDCGSGPALNFAAGAPFTVAGWFKTADPNGTVFSLRNSKDGGADVDVTVEGGGLHGLVRQDGGEAGLPAAVRSRNRVNDNAWHHFALTRDGRGGIELFVDGASQGRASSQHAAGAITTDLRAVGSERYWVSQRMNGFGGVSAYFDGSVDEVCVFNRILTPGEVRLLAGR